MSIGIITTTLERRSPTWEQTLATGLTKDDLNEIIFEAGWRGVAGLTAYTIDGQTYEVTVLKFVKVAELQEDMGLPVLTEQ